MTGKELLEKANARLARVDTALFDASDKGVPCAAFPYMRECSREIMAATCDNSAFLSNGITRVITSAVRDVVLETLREAGVGNGKTSGAEFNWKSMGMQLRNLTPKTVIGSIAVISFFGLLWFKMPDREQLAAAMRRGRQADAEELRRAVAQAVKEVLPAVLPAEIEKAKADVLNAMSKKKSD